MRLFSMSRVVVACGAMALIAVALAFPGSERAGLWMGTPVAIAAVSLLCLWIGWSALRAFVGGRWASFLLHFGCALILGGWVWGRTVQLLGRAPEAEVVGSLCLSENEESRELRKGHQLRSYAGELPFSVKVVKLDIVSPYEASCELRIAESNRVPCTVELHNTSPVYLSGYCVAQSYWDKVQDPHGFRPTPTSYTVLQFIRDTGGRPVTGAMALWDGDCTDTLWSGERLTEYVGRIPFSVRLNRCWATRYAGPESPVKEYCSQVTILEPGREPRNLDILVNHPAYIQGYWIYQWNYTETRDSNGYPIKYTVLRFSRDPGVPVVFFGFGFLLTGLFLVTVRTFRRRFTQSAR